MSRDEIRRKTCLIIRRENEYLVGTILYSTDLRWSVSPYDAWSTRVKEDAERVARATGGRPVLFNPVARQLKEMEGREQDGH